MDDYDTDSSNDSLDRRTKRRRVKQTVSYLAAAAAALASLEDQSEPCNSSTKTPRTRTPRSATLASKKLYVKDDNGSLVEMKPRMSPWYLNYIENPKPLDVKWLRKFRLRFRLPFSAFKSLLKMIQSSEFWTVVWWDATPTKSSFCSYRTSKPGCIALSWPRVDV